MPYSSRTVIYNTKLLRIIVKAQVTFKAHVMNTYGVVYLFDSNIRE